VVRSSIGTALAACARTQAPGPVHFFAEGMPDALADWNVVYVADGRLRLNDRVLPYDLATPLFTDYAHKLRTVWMPDGQSARYEAQDSFDFPVGTILSKTFYYPLADSGRGDGNPVSRRGRGVCRVRGCLRARRSRRLEGRGRT
jgi:hypothetical protein